MSQAPCTFTRSFSEIEGYQSAHALTYSFEADADGTTCLTVTRTGASPCRESVRVAAGPEQVRRMLQFFCENAVQPELWRDLLADLCPPAACGPAGT